MRKLLVLFLFLTCLTPAHSQTWGGGRDLLPALGSGELSSVRFPSGTKLKAWTTSEYAPIFNGVNSFASTTADVAASTEYTVMLWLKPYGATTNGRFLSTRVSAASASVDLFQSSVATLGASVSNVSFTAQSAPAGAWLHVALTKTAASATIYTGATARETKTVPAGQSLFDGEKSLGRYTTQYGNCSIAELSFWNRALSQAEIQKYYTKRLKGTEPGLVAYYPLNEPPGSTVFVDKVGGKNAVASNSPQITRRNGYAAPDVRSERYCLSGDGVDDSCVGTQSAIVGYPFSFDVWAQSTFTADNQNLVLFNIGSATTTGSDYRMVRMRQVSGVQRLQFIDNGVASMDIPSGLQNGAWNHISVVHNATSSYVFFNGSLATSTPGIALTSAGKINFGGVAGTSSLMKGKLANLRIWNKALSQVEIQALRYQTSTGNEPDLVGNFKINEGTGTDATNSVSVNPGSMTATLVNSPTWVGRDIP